MIKNDRAGTLLWAIFTLIGVLVSCAALAETDCRYVEYPDHYEAICTGSAQPLPDPQKKSVSAAVPEQATFQKITSPPPSDVQDQLHPGNDPPIVMSLLAKKHWEHWLKTQPHQ